MTRWATPLLNYKFDYKHKLFYIMKNLFAALVLIALLVSACSKVPLTGRRQFNLVPDATLNQMSFDAYRDVLKESKIMNTGGDVTLVKRVGNDIAAAVGTYLRQHKLSKLANEFKWEYNVIDDASQVNAFCMPGGKVAVYSGILPVAKDANGLAVVMGHEIAHAVARHGNERMSHGLVQQLGAVGLAVALKDKPQQTQQLFMSAYGLGSQVGILLPFSRKHESEADELGLTFMAMAGYNPAASVDFWSRMSSKGGGAQPPEFLSTHPSHSTRISDLKKQLAKAQKIYDGAPKKENTSLSGSAGNTPSNDGGGGTTTGGGKAKTKNPGGSTGGGDTPSTPSGNTNTGGGTGGGRTGGSTTNANPSGKTSGTTTNPGGTNMPTPNKSGKTKAKTKTKPGGN